MLVGVIIPLGRIEADFASPKQRNAAVSARIDTLLYRYEQPEQQAWGVDVARGYTCDWWQIGGRWQGWGNAVRKAMEGRGFSSSKRPIPQWLRANAIWAEDLGRVALSWFSLFPFALITPYGEWIEEPDISGRIEPTTRDRKLKAAWLRNVRKMLRALPGFLVVGIDCHY